MRPSRLPVIVLGLLTLGAPPAPASPPTPGTVRATDAAREAPGPAHRDGDIPAHRGHGHQQARNAAEVAYSELNHRVAGGFLAVLAVLAALTASPRRARLGVVAAIVWIAFGGYLLVSADPEAWPLGAGRFADIFADALVLQHKLLALIPVAIGLVEIARAAGRGVAVARVVPVLAIAGGIGLVVHDHEGGWHLDRTFVQHAVMGAAGIVTGGALLVMRRLPWAWPALLGLTAVVLLVYAE